MAADVNDTSIFGLMLNRRNFRRLGILFQLLFWALWTMLIYSSVAARESPLSRTQFVMFQVPITMFATYLNYHLFIPRFLERRKYVAYILMVILLVVSLEVLRMTIRVNIMGNTIDLFRNSAVGMTITSLLMLGGIMVKFADRWFRVSQSQIALQNEQLKSELRFLKTQINPHFLFNTLNNLYTLTLLQDTRAPRMVAKLSEIMRYLIQDTQVNRVPLLKELELLQSYNDLYLLQTEEVGNADIYSEGITNQHKIAPLLLINFLENAFKHGDIRHNPRGWIAISAVVEEDEAFHFQITNSVSSDPIHSAQVSFGIGLENVRRQLELNYPDRHRFLVKKSETEFKVDLYLILSDPEQGITSQQMAYVQGTDRG